MSSVLFTLFKKKSTFFYVIISRALFPENVRQGFAVLPAVRQNQIDTDSVMTDDSLDNQPIPGGSWVSSVSLYKQSCNHYPILCIHRFIRCKYLLAWLCPEPIRCYPDPDIITDPVLSDYLYVNYSPLTAQASRVDFFRLR